MPENSRKQLNLWAFLKLENEIQNRSDKFDGWDLRQWLSIEKEWVRFQTKLVRSNFGPGQKSFIYNHICPKNSHKVLIFFPKGNSIFLVAQSNSTCTIFSWFLANQRNLTFWKSTTPFKIRKYYKNVYKNAQLHTHWRHWLYFFLFCHFDLEKRATVAWRKVQLKNFCNVRN